jgi:hypothetical protein
MGPPAHDDSLFQSEDSPATEEFDDSQMPAYEDLSQDDGLDWEFAANGDAIHREGPWNEVL